MGKGVVQSSLAVGVYHRGDGVFSCRRALGERDGSVNAARFGVGIRVTFNGVCGGCCVLVLSVRAPGDLGRLCSYGANDGRDKRIILSAGDKNGDGGFLRSREGGQGEADEAEGCGMHGYAVGAVRVLL